jgi:hypothetical protein
MTIDEALAAFKDQIEVQDRGGHGVRGKILELAFDGETMVANIGTAQLPWNVDILDLEFTGTRDPNWTRNVVESARRGVKPYQPYPDGVIVNEQGKGQVWPPTH